MTGGAALSERHVQVDLRVQILSLTCVCLTEVKPHLRAQPPLLIYQESWWECAV